MIGFGRTLDRQTGELSRDRRALVFPVRCESWSCACCVAGVLRRRAQRRVFKGAAAPGRVFMLTLTIDPADARWRRFRGEYLRREWPRLAYHAAGWDARWRTAITRASIRYAAASWNRMRTHAVKDPALAGLFGGDGMAFSKAVELQRNGRAHLHVLLRVPSLESGFAYRRRLREVAVAAGFGGDVERGRGMGFDMQAARSRADLARYVSKGARVEGYVVKAGDLMPRYTRRFSYSRSWCEWTPATRIAGWWDWHLAGGSPGTVTRALEASGYGICDPAAFRVTSAGGVPAGG